MFKALTTLLKSLFSRKKKQKRPSSIYPLR